MTRTRPTGSRVPLTLCATLVLAGCMPTPSPQPPPTPGATATEAALCRAWRDSLPGRSRQDTPQTQGEIGHAYDVQAAACPDFPRFPPA